MNNEVINEIININIGVKQGGILSPYLFNFYIDDLLNEISNAQLGCRMGNKSITALAYCDDIVILSRSISQMNDLLDICAKFSSTWLLKFNATKTKSMNIGYKFYSNDEIIFNLNNIIIEIVREITYLGLLFNEDLNRNKYFAVRYSKVEARMFSLYNFGMKNFSCLTQNRSKTCSSVTIVDCSGSCTNGYRSDTCIYFDAVKPESITIQANYKLVLQG